MDRRRAAGALIALAACIASSAAAPTFSNQTALDLYDAATEGCYYNFQHYGEGDRIMTNEPCLNCTCHNRMLMCYLRVCPFTKPIGQDCTVEKRADQCCPIVTCPDVPVDLLTSTSTSSPAEYGATGVGKLDKYGCSINGKYFSEGSKVPPTPNKPCEHCYCIRNMTTCVMQECTLHVDGCTPIYHKDVCCPVRYSCDHPEDEILGLDDMSTTVRPTPGFLLTTTTVSPVTQVTQDCVHNDQIFADGTSIKTEKACEHCYCMKGDIVCVVQECGTPMENEGKNCTSQPPREGQCCPDTYICEGDELTTELPSDLSTQPLLEELTTLAPPRRTEEEGSGYRNEPDELIPSEIPVVEPDVEGSGDELVTMQPLDVSDKYTPAIEDTFASTEGQDFVETTKAAVEDEKTSLEPDSELNTVPSGITESSVPKLTTLTEETKTSDEQEKITAYNEYPTTQIDTLRTTKESVLHTTESSFRKEDKLQAPDISTQKAQDEYTTLEPMPTKETHEEEEEMRPTIEDDTKITKPSDETVTMTITELSTSLPSNFSKPIIEPSQPSEHTISEMQSTTVTPEKIETTTINAYENEIEDNVTPQGAGRIPGEGDCLQAGITYRNDSSVPSINNCQTDCKCISSIIKCDPIICSPPPEYMSNCVPTYDSSESCCPTYVCDGSKETLPPQPHSQMSETESSTPTPTVECHDDQCEAQDKKTPEVPVCTSQDCLTELNKPQTSDCMTENCKVIEQIPIQPDLQTACGPTGCDEKTETTHHEPSSVLPVTPESCTDAECKQDVTVTPCEGENCKIDSTVGCQNEEDCKNVQDISKIDTSCKGDACKEIPVDCGATGCDVSPPIKEIAEVCDGENCKKMEETAPECPDGNCRRKETPDVEGKLPSECTDSSCVPQKPESPEVSVSETVSAETEKPDISATPDIQSEVTLSPETTSDQGSGMQTELSHDVETKVTQTSTDNLVTESSTGIPKLTEITTTVSELSPEEATSAPQTVEIKQTSELPTTAPHDMTTQVSDTNVIVSQPQDESVPVDKITTMPQSTSVESHTLSETEAVKDITEASITMASVAHEAESSDSTYAGDFVTKVPDVFTTEQYQSTQIQEEIITSQEDDKLPKDTEQKLTTLSSVKEDLEKHTDQEVITKSPVFASEMTAMTLENEQIFTTSTQQSVVTEKPQSPEVPEVYHVTTESSVEYPSGTQSVLSTEYPSIPEEKTETITGMADITHASETFPAKLDETTISSEISEIQTTVSPKESEFTKPQEIYTEKSDIHTQEPILSTTISPEVYFTDKVTDQASTMKEKESTEISKEPKGEEQRTTTTPLISLEPELETEMPTSVTDIEDMPIKTESPLSSVVVPKEKLPEELENAISTEPEIETEEPSIQEEPSVTEHEEFISESPLEPESPVYIPVHLPTIEEKDKPEQPDKEIPVIPVIPETMPEYIPSTTQRLEITTLEPDVVTQKHMTDKDIKEPEFDKSDEITQSPFSEMPGSEITEVHTEREPETTSTSEESYETATESKQIATEEEDITKATDAPESIVKDTEEKLPITSEITGAETTEKQTPIEKIQTEPPVIVTPETSETVLPDLGLSTKTQKPDTELEETATKTSDQTTEQYDHSETLPDMIELVEHHPISDITTIPPISDEVTTVSYKKPTTTYVDTQEVEKEHKLEDTLTTIRPMKSEIDHEPTKSSEESTDIPSTTQGYEQTFDGEVSTKHQDIAEVGHTVIIDDKSETQRPEIPVLEQSSIPDKETVTEKSDISDIEPGGITAQDVSTEKLEIPVNEQEVILEEKPVTEKLETPVMEKDVTRLEESTEREITAEPEVITKEPDNLETEYTTRPDKVLQTESLEIPGMEAEKERTTERPATETVLYDSSKEPETSTSRHEITSAEPSVTSQDEYATKGSEAPVTEYIIPGQESVTKLETEEQMPEKSPSTEKTIDIEHEVTSEKESSASETEYEPTTEIKLIPSQESTTMVSEGIELDTKPGIEVTTITHKPEIPTAEQEMKPDKEISTTVPDIMYTESEIKPEEKHSTMQPEISDTEHERKPESETTIIPEAPLVEQEVKPVTDFSTERTEISDVEKEDKSEVGQATQQTEKPESVPEVTPGKELSGISTTELTQSQEPVTGLPKTTTNEPETKPDEVTEKTEITVGHEGLPEQGSMTKEPESTIIDHDILSGQEQTTKEPAGSEIEDEEIPQKKDQTTERPETTETVHEIVSEQESATTKPTMSITDHEIGLDQDSATGEPETPKLEDEMKPDKEPSTERAETTEDEISTELAEKPDIEIQSSTEQSEKPEIEQQYSTTSSQIPETKPQSSTERSELPEIEPELSTEPSKIPEVEPQSSTEREEMPEIEPQFSTEQSKEPEIEPQSSTERSEEPEIEPQSSTERSEEPELVPESSTERSEEPEIEPQSSTERFEEPELVPELSTERSEEPYVGPESSTERSEEPYVEPPSSTERVEVPKIESQHFTHPSEVPETELQSTSERSEIPEIETQPSTERLDVPEIVLQSSTEPSKITDVEHETKSSEAPELEIDSDKSTEKIEPEQEMKPATETIEPLVESEADNELTPDKESSTKLPEVPETEHDISLSTERSETPEFKPIEGSSTERTETTEYESKEPETVITEHDVIDQQTSTRLPEISEITHEIKPESGSTTERSEVPETTDRVTSTLPSEDQTKSKPIEEEIIIKTTTEIPSSVIYDSTVAIDKELPEKSTEPSIEKTTSIISLSSSPEEQKDIVKQDEDLTTLFTTSRYPLKEELTTAIISESEKLPTPATEVPVQTERETDKPTESKDTTAPEEEFLTVTTKSTTPKMEEVTPTQSPSYDNFTKPHDRPESDILPSSVVPETPKPSFNEVQATDEIPSPEDDGHFAPSATGGYGGQETDYEDENQPFGPGTCRYGGKVYVSAQQIPRDDPCDFCFCFRSDIICLQQSCPPPIHGCHEEPIQGFCCPRYECPVSMANTLNITTTTTTTTTTLPPHFNLNAYQGAAQRRGCQIKGHTYKVGEVVRASSGPCLHCTCGGDGQMKCDPKACTPEPMLRQMIAAAVSAKRRR